MYRYAGGHASPKAAIAAGAGRRAQVVVGEGGRAGRCGRGSADASAIDRGRRSGRAAGRAGDLHVPGAAHPLRLPGRAGSASTRTTGGHAIVDAAGLRPRSESTSAIRARPAGWTSSRATRLQASASTPTRMPGARARDDVPRLPSPTPTRTCAATSSEDRTDLQVRHPRDRDGRPWSRRTQTPARAQRRPHGPRPYPVLSPSTAARGALAGTRAVPRVVQATGGGRRSPAGSRAELVRGQSPHRPRWLARRARGGARST